MKFSQTDIDFSIFFHPTENL